MMDTKPLASSRRQLLKGFGLFMGGFLLASSLAYWLHVQERQEAQKMELTEVSYDLLGFLGFKEGKFGILENVQDEAKKTIDKHGLNENLPNRFAYVVNTTTNEIVWSASQLGKPYSEVRFALGKGQPDFKPRFEQARPLPPKDTAQLESDPSLKHWYGQEYLLAVQEFTQREGVFQFIVGEPVN